MTAPIATFNLSATVSAASGPIAVGDVVVPIGGVFYKATAANRATAAVRAQGVAMTAWSASTTGAVIVQNVGIIDAATTALGAGAASWVRVSSAGVLERAAVSGTDDVVGFCAADGTLYALFGMFTAAIVNGGGGGGFTPPTGTGLMKATLGAMDVASSLLVNADVSASAGIAANKVVQATGTGIPHVVAGALSAASSLIVDADVTSVGVAKLTGLGTNVATLLASFSAANLLAALLTKTGTGVPVFGTAPTISDPVITVARIANATSGGTINNCTLAGTSGNVRRLYFTDAVGPTITGFDATGVADGTYLEVTAANGGVAITADAGLLSTASNRCTLQGGTTITVAGGVMTTFQYDTTASRWRHTAATAI